MQQLLFIISKIHTSWRISYWIISSCVLVVLMQWSCICITLQVHDHCILNFGKQFSLFYWPNSILINIRNDHSNAHMLTYAWGDHFTRCRLGLTIVYQLFLHCLHFAKTFLAVPNTHFTFVKTTIAQYSLPWLITLGLHNHHINKYNWINFNKFIFFYIWETLQMAGSRFNWSSLMNFLIANIHCNEKCLNVFSKND